MNKRLIHINWFLTVNMDCFLVALRESFVHSVERTLRLGLVMGQLVKV